MKIGKYSPTFSLVHQAEPHLQTKVFAVKNGLIPRQTEKYYQTKISEIPLFPICVAVMVQACFKISWWFDWEGVP